MRQLVAVLVGGGLLLGVLPAAAQPAGGPPAPASSLSGVRIIGIDVAMNLEDCTPDSFATETEADQAAVQRSPAGDWYVVQAPDAPHVLAKAVGPALIGQLPAPLPPELGPADWEELLAATYARVCAILPFGPPPASNRESAGVAAAALSQRRCV